MKRIMEGVVIGVVVELPRFRGQLIAWHSSRLLIAPLEVQG